MGKLRQEKVIARNAKGQVTGEIDAGITRNVIAHIEMRVTYLVH